MKRAMLVVPLVTSLMLFGAAFAPAQASFQDDVINAATNMIRKSDVPKALRPLPKSQSFISLQPTPRAFLCVIGAADDKSKKLPITGKYSQQDVAFVPDIVTLSSIGEGASLTQAVMQFERPKAAAKSFAQLAKDIGKCGGGTSTNSHQNTDGSTFTEIQASTTGTLKTATDGGEKPVFLLNSVSTSGQYETGERDNANYIVYSLANNVISAIMYQPTIGVNMTKKTQKAVDQLSMKAAAHWVS